MSTPSSMIITASFATTLSKTLEIAGATSVDYSLNQSITFGAGAGASQANSFWADDFTVDSTGTTVNFAAPGTDAFGDSPAFTGIKAMIVKNLSATLALAVQAGASNGLTTLFDTASKGIIIAPLSTLVLVSALAAGWVVASGGARNVLFKAPSATINLQLMLLGNG